MVDIFEICKDLPPGSGTIVDNMIIAMSKINSPIYKKILCTISGGEDSDIVLDICTKLDEGEKIDYVNFDTGLEYEATKNHLRYLEKKYKIQIKTHKAELPIPTACRKYGQPFLSKEVSEKIYRLQKHGFKWEDKSFSELYREYPKCKAALRWWCNDYGENSKFNISRWKYLKEFMVAHPPSEFDLMISAKCCDFAKKNVLHNAIIGGGYDLCISGVRKYEGGGKTVCV